MAILHEPIFVRWSARLTSGESLSRNSGRHRMTSRPFAPGLTQREVNSRAKFSRRASLLAVRRLLEGAKAVEAGDLDGKVPITSKDEIGHLTTAFNQMVEQLRLKERIRETFGKYVDPRIVEGLIDRPILAAEGQRRVMTVLFCDVRGFTSTSEGVTPQVRG